VVREASRSHQKRPALRGHVVRTGPWPGTVLPYIAPAGEAVLR
jgi:hypothetical protein